MWRRPRALCRFVYLRDARQERGHVGIRARRACREVRLRPAALREMLHAGLEVLSLRVLGRLAQRQDLVPAPLPPSIMGAACPDCDAACVNNCTSATQLSSKRDKVRASLPLLSQASIIEDCAQKTLKRQNA